MDASGQLAEMQASPGQDGDGPHGRDLLEEFERGEMEHVLGDAAYDGDEMLPTSLLSQIPRVLNRIVIATEDDCCTVNSVQFNPPPQPAPRPHLF